MEMKIRVAILKELNCTAHVRTKGMKHSKIIKKYACQYVLTAPKNLIFI